MRIDNILRTLHESILLRAVLDLDERHQTAGRADVEQRIQHRDFAWLGAEDHANRCGEHFASAGTQHRAAQPVLERARVPVTTTARSQRVVNVDLAREPVERANRAFEIDEAPHRHRRDRARVADQTIALFVELPAGLVRWKRLDPEFGGKCCDAWLTGPEPLSAEIECRVADALAQRATTDTIARFENDDTGARSAEFARARESRETRANYNDVDLGWDFARQHRCFMHVAWIVSLLDCIAWRRARRFRDRTIACVQCDPHR